MATAVERGEVEEGEGGRRRENLVRWRLENSKQLFRDNFPTTCNLGGRERKRREETYHTPTGLLLLLTSRREQLQCRR